MPKRIYIFGGTASGKTTLAERLSKKLGIPYYTTDEFVYKREKGWGLKHSEEARDRNVKRIAEKAKWIVEGVHDAEWIAPLFRKADFVIILDLPRHKLIGRVISREIKRFFGNYERKSKFGDIPKLIKYAYIYKSDSLIKHRELVRKHAKKFVLVKNQGDLERLFASLEK